MTAKLSSAFEYGMHEMSASYRFHASIALVCAILFHLTIIGTYFLVMFIRGGEETFVEKNWRRPIFFDVIPSNSFDNIISRIPVHIGPRSQTLGTFVPIPDIDLKSEDNSHNNNALNNSQDGWQGSEEGTGLLDNGISMTGVEVDPSPDSFIVVERLPVPVKQVAPGYPDIALRAEVEGTVWLKVLVDKQGHPKKVLVIKSDSDILSEAAKRAAFEWLFTPAIMNNGPVAVWTSIPFRFKLNK